MELENVFTYAVDSRSRYFDMNAGEDAAYENPELAEKIGAIEGQLVLGTEMMKSEALPHTIVRENLFLILLFYTAL